MNLFSTPRLRVLVSVWWAFHCSKQALALDENAKSCSNSSALQCAGFFFLCSSQLREKCCLGTCLTWFQRFNLCALSKDLIQFLLLPSADCSLLRAGRGSTQAILLAFFNMSFPLTFWNQVLMYFLSWIPQLLKCRAQISFKLMHWLRRHR